MKASGSARPCGQHEPLQAAPFDKEFKGDGEAEHEVLSILGTRAKEFKGDGEVEHEVLTNLQSQAKGLKDDGEEQHEVPTNLQSQAKEVDAGGSASPCGQRGPLESNHTQDGGGGNGDGAYVLYSHR